MTGAAGRLLAGAAASLLLAFAAFAADPTEPIPVPKLTGRVVDLTGTLSGPQREAIGERLRAFEAAKGAQIAVLLVPSIGTETIEEFATRVTDAWQLGRAGIDDGVLFVIAKQERIMRIQTGRGVQGVLTDALSKRIIAERVTPRFRAGDFAGGIGEGVDAIIRAIEGEALPPPKGGSTAGRPHGQSWLQDYFWFAVAGIVVLSKILRVLVGRFPAALLSAGLAGFGVWFFFGSLLFGAIAAFVAFLFALLSGTPGIGGPSGGWSSGGGGWSGGGGGGGGFSGGGGGFDGGGASGRW